MRIKHFISHAAIILSFMFFVAGVCPAQEEVPSAATGDVLSVAEEQPQQGIQNSPAALLQPLLADRLPLAEGSLGEGGEKQILDVLDLKNMDILDVLKLISQKSGLNIIAGHDVHGRITVFLKDIEVKEALRIIVEAYGWAYIEDGRQTPTDSASGILKVITDQEYEAKYGHKFGQEVRTRIRQLLFAKAPDVAVILNEVKGKAGKVIADSKSGTLILMDESKKLEEMEGIIQQVDVSVETEVF